MNWAMHPQVLEIWVEILGVVLLALYFLCGFVERYCRFHRRMRVVRCMNRMRLDVAKLCKR